MNQIYDHKIAQYDRIYRGFLVVSMIAILAGTAVGVHQVFVVSNRIDESTNATQQSLRCIGEYFTQTNRANLRIKDISTCTLVRN